MSRSTPIAALLVALLLWGCGDSGTQTESAPQSRAADSADRSYVAAADRICAGMIAESRRMGARFLRQPNNGLDALTLTTRELVAPALPILERSARRLRSLAADAESLDLDSYVSLYDPIVAVVRDRVAAGEAGDGTRAHELELQLIDLSNLQRRLAREAGLGTCDVDFIHTFATGAGAG